MKNLCIIFTLIITYIGQLKAQTHNVFHVGHSLVNLIMPSMLKSIANSANGVNHSYNYHVGNGASMNFIYTNPNSPGGQGAKFFTELPSGKHDILVLTEAVPLKGHLAYSGTYEYADSFYQLILRGNSKAKCYIYETWHCLKSGNTNNDTCDWDRDSRIPWRTRITNDLNLWEGIMQSVKSKHTNNEVYIIPAGQCWGALYDTIRAGKLPGYSDVKQLFSDDIHPNLIGNYFVALVHFATIYGRSPVGLTTETKDIDGLTISPKPTPEVARKMQETVWQVVSNYKNSGVKPGVTSVQNNINNIFMNMKLSFEY